MFMYFLIQTDSLSQGLQQRWNPQPFHNLVQDKNPADGFNLCSTSILHVSQHKQGFMTDEGEGKKDCSVSNTLSRPCMHTHAQE